MLITKRCCNPGSGWYHMKERQLWQALEYRSSEIMEAPLLVLYDIDSSHLSERNGSNF